MCVFVCYSFQNYAMPMCVVWDSAKNNWTQDGCQVVVDKDGKMARDDIIICTCNKLGVYGVYVVSRPMRL